MTTATIRTLTDAKRWLAGWKPVRKVKPVPLPPLPSRRKKAK